MPDWRRRWTPCKTCRCRPLELAVTSPRLRRPPCWTWPGMAGYWSGGWGQNPAASRRAGLRHLADHVQARKQAGDIVVASLHWGGNWGYGVLSEQRQFAQRLIAEAGVDIVHGHSSHHPKGIEVFRGKLILYGCGDFLRAPRRPRASTLCRTTWSLPPAPLGSHSVTSHTPAASPAGHRPAARRLPLWGIPVGRRGAWRRAAGMAERLSAGRKMASNAMRAAGRQEGRLSPCYTDL
jgi:hypothetical protein